MYAKLPFSTLILNAATLSLLAGCSAIKLPSHDGSLHSVYGVDKPKQNQVAVVEDRVVEEPPATPVVSAASEYEPTIQTLDSDEILIEPQLIPAPVLSATTTSQPELPTIETSDKTSITSGMAVLSEAVSSEQIPDTPKENEPTFKELESGETLFSIAKEVTGKSSNWKVIADYNGISEPAAITVGQIILIPPQYNNTETQSTTQTAYDAEPAQTIETTVVKTTLASEGKVQTETQEEAAVSVSANGVPVIEFAALETTLEDDQSKDNETQNVAITAVETRNMEPSVAAPITPTASQISDSTSVRNTTNAAQKVAATTTAASEVKTGVLQKTFSDFASIVKTSFKIPERKTQQESKVAEDSTLMANTEIASEIEASTPQVLDTPTIATTETNSTTEQWIQIDGDFTPKAIYKGAGYGSGLLMRVSPGTTLRMTQKEENWYQVETDKGTGYVFYKDVLDAH